MNTYTQSAIKYSAPVFLGVLAFPFFAFASYIDISPKVIDIKGRSREISHHGITLKNKSTAILSTFVWAVDVDQAKGDLSRGDMSGLNSNNYQSSPSRWFEISRSLQVLPNEEQSIPLQVQIPNQTKPGIYHVSLKFSYGTTQNEAMACESCTESVSVNIEVTEDIREKLQLFSFSAVKSVFIQPKADFKFSVENTGNKTLIPNGKIRIFDNSGKEVGLIDVNTEGKQIEPKAKDLLAASWAASGKFGKYKAMLDVSYGQKGTMQDIVYFWVIPWTRLFGFIITILSVMIIAMLFARSRTLSRPQYVYEEYNRDDEDDFEPVVSNEIHIPAKNLKINNTQVRLNDNLINSKINNLTEVNIPPRIRTVPPNMTISIEEKKKSYSEDHIVRLK